MIAFYQRLMLVLAFSILVGSSSAQTPEIPAELVPRIEQLLEQYQVPGVSVAVLSGNRIAWSGGVGRRDALGPDPVDRETLFQAASLSKPVTAVMTLLMVQDGQLDLDQPVSDYLVSFPVPAAKRVTLRALLSHTAGLNVSGFPGYPPQVHRPTLEQIILGRGDANTEAIRITGKPGTRYEYSGGGYCLVQQAILDVSGRNFDTLAKDRLFAHTKMDDSTFSQPLAVPLQKNAASGHESSGRPVEGRWHVYPELAAAGLWTNAEDLARMILHLQHSFSGADEALLSEESARELLTPQLNGGDNGLGFFVQETDPGTFYHTGANRGFRCMLAATKKPGGGTVIMTNSSNGEAIYRPLLDLIKGSLAGR